jgi:CHAT domain-containing protein
MESSGLDRLLESAPPASTRTNFSSLLALGYDGAIGDADRLNHAEDEAQAIASSWLAGSVQTLIGAEASWTGLQAAGLATVDILHIASHATITQGLASESCLRLAQTDQPEPVDVSMIAALDLNTELVFLSCCEAGRHQGTSSGVMDFSQAFIEAGAKSVLSSSVRVDDRAGLELAQLFYHHWLAGKSRPQALRAAQLEMMQQVGRWDHPFYWSFYRLISGTDPTR